MTRSWPRRREAGPSWSPPTTRGGSTGSAATTSTAGSGRSCCRRRTRRIALRSRTSSPGPTIPRPEGDRLGLRRGRRLGGGRPGPGPRPGRPGAAFRLKPARRPSPLSGARRSPFGPIVPAAEAIALAVVPPGDERRAEPMADPSGPVEGVDPRVEDPPGPTSCSSRWPWPRRRWPARRKGRRPPPPRRRIAPRTRGGPTTRGRPNRCRTRPPRGSPPRPCSRPMRRRMRPIPRGSGPRNNSSTPGRRWAPGPGRSGWRPTPS
jgi:hypothetical protein